MSDTSINVGRSESPTEDFEQAVAKKVDDVLTRHLSIWTTREHRASIRNDLLSAINSHLDWPCVHEEVATYGLTVRCTSCGVEVAEAQGQEDSPA